LKQRTVIVVIAAIAVIGFFGWRFVRPMNIFVVSEAFERPVDTSAAPESLGRLRASECAACHREFHDEWSTTIHSQAWTDPYFQTDWKFDGAQQICKNCHTPLDRQQEHNVLGFRDQEKWDPILEPNPDFDPVLQHEGVTCAVCHYRDGKILGPYGDTAAPHPVQKLANGNEICARCHVVGGERWDSFFRFPPCGTVAEIQASQSNETARSGEAVITDTAALGCVECHMPLVERPLVEGGKVRSVRRHLWRGGHDPDMVRQGLDIRFAKTALASPDQATFTLTLTNVGAGHYLPTGTPDRHLTVALRLLDRDGNVIEEQNHMLRRTVMWRPFIVDLWDTRLAPGEPRSYAIESSRGEAASPAAVEAIVRYYLVDEKRRNRIGYVSGDPTSYEVYRERILLSAD